MFPMVCCSICRNGWGNIGDIQARVPQITKAICKSCYEKTKHKWKENDWEITTLDSSAPSLEP